MSKRTPGPRFTVKPVTGIGLGAGGFVVVDNEDGSEWGLTIWRDEAEKLASRWNAEARSAIAKAGGAV